MSTDTETFTHWATEMITILEGEQLEQVRWFARVNSVLVSFNSPMTYLYSTDSVLETPQNLTTWRSQHGEEDVHNGIAILRDHVRSHWRPSWYEIAGGLKPENFSNEKTLHLPSSPISASAVDVHSRSSSPDIMEVERPLANAVSTDIHVPLPKVQLTDIRHKPVVTPLRTHNKEKRVKPPPSTISHGPCEEDTIVIPAANPPLKVPGQAPSTPQGEEKMPEPIVQEGPMTRRRRRDENTDQPANAAKKVSATKQSPFAQPQGPADEKEDLTTRQPPKTTAPRVAPRQPARPRRAPVEVQVRRQPARNARKKAVQDAIPQSQSRPFIGFTISVHPAHLT